MERPLIFFVHKGILLTPKSTTNEFVTLFNACTGPIHLNKHVRVRHLH